MPATAEETLADEARRRTRAGAVAIAAGLLTIIGGALSAVVFGDQPTVPLLDALRERLQAAPPAVTLKMREAVFYDGHAATVVIAAVLSALAAAGIGIALGYLYRSTNARRPLARAVIVAVIAGATLIAVGQLTHDLGLVIASHRFAGLAHPTDAAARDVLRTPTAVVGVLFRQLGFFAIGIGFVILALNAMRVGLLTRFMGVLGIIVGALFVIPLGASLPIVQAFWLVALGALFLGFWPPGLPPAWVTGEAQPWPTQQEIRELRLERKGLPPDKPREPRGRRGRPEPPETPAPEAPARPAHSSSKKRKRRRR